MDSSRPFCRIITPFIRHFETATDTFVRPVCLNRPSALRLYFSFANHALHIASQQISVNRPQPQSSQLTQSSFEPRHMMSFKFLCSLTLLCLLCFAVVYTEARLRSQCRRAVRSCRVNPFFHYASTVCSCRDLFVDTKVTAAMICIATDRAILLLAGDTVERMIPF